MQKKEFGARSSDSDQDEVVAAGASAHAQPSGRRAAREPIVMPTPASKPKGDASPLARLEELACLGMGSFGKVTLQEDRGTGRVMAMKTVRNDAASRNERDILQLIKSPFVVSFIDACEQAEQMHIFMEPLLGGDLHSACEEHDK